MTKNEADKQQYYGIDLFKFLMAILVVAIHTQPLYGVESILLHRIFDTITSLAVPYFFAASGYLLFLKFNDSLSSIDNFRITKKYLSRVFYLYIVWNVIYIPITIYGYMEYNMSIGRYLLDCVRGLFIIGQQFYSWQLWYLLSVFFSTACLCVLIKNEFLDKKIIMIMMTIFLCGGVIGILTSIDFSGNTLVNISIKGIKMLLGSGRILSGCGYMMVGWFVMRRKNKSLCLDAVWGGLLFFLLLAIGDTYGFLLKLFIAGVLLRISCEIVLGYRELWQHLRYMAELIYFTHMWIAFSYTLFFKDFRYYGVDIFLISTIIPIIFYVLTYKSLLFKKIKNIL